MVAKIINNQQVQVLAFSSSSPFHTGPGQQNKIAVVVSLFHFSGQLDLYTPTEQPKFKPIPNPYSTGVPTTEMCHGREDDLKFLQDNLTRTNAGTFVILYGQRRSGKTTLLLQLANTNAILDRIMESSQLHFKWLWDQCTLDEHYVLAIMAKLGGEEGRSLSHRDRRAVQILRASLQLTFKLN